MKKYTIYYGGGTAILYTTHDPKERFYKLAGTCFGIRKSIMCFEIRKTEEAACDDYERLEFGGDVYMYGVRMELGKRLNQLGLLMMTGTQIIAKNANGEERIRKHDRT